MLAKINRFKKFIFIAGTVAAILLVCIHLFLTYRQPEVCVLCGSGARERYHAPVILNLATGQSNEMRVYDPDLPNSDLEIAKVQNTGTFSFASCAGLVGRRDTCAHTCTVDIPMKTKSMKPSNFCSDCRELLEIHREQGYVLVDLYDEDAIYIYSISKEAEYKIRDYIITITQNTEAAELEVEVLGQIEGLVFVD